MPTCTYCKADVSPNAKQCPKCGDNLKVMREKERDKIMVPIISSIIGIFVLFNVTGWISALIGILFLAAGILAFFFPDYFSDN